MKEKKFRVWDGENNKFHYFDIYTVPTVQHLLTIDDAELLPEFIQQYTGLKDKNGKEIYGGDICRAFRGEQEKPNTRYEITGKVIWFRGGFEVFNKSLSEFYTDDKGNLKDCSWCYHGNNNIPDIYEEIIDIEVIGNIYENKELLK